MMALLLTVAAVFIFLHWHPSSEIAVHDNRWFSLSGNIGPVFAPVAFAGLMSRYRRSDRAERMRIKWILWGLGVFVAIYVFGSNLAMPLVTIAGFFALFTAYGIGIVRHNLFDVNVVISRSVTYALLAGFLRLPIVESGSRLGSLDVHLPPGQTLPDRDRLLAQHLAAGMGLALSNQVLTERLAARIDELSRSRRRLIALQDHTRRRLERDLHDGAQQQLVALKVKLGLCRSLVGRSDDSEMPKLIERLSADADEAVECLRDFARGVYPPLLEAEGLEAAIGAQVRRSCVPVEIDADGVGRYPREIESTVYFCVLEALSDVADRSRATKARVHLSQCNGGLTFEVHDDGQASVDSASRPGLRRIGDRLEALSGGLDYCSEPGAGTTVTGSLPTTSTTVGP